MTSPLTRREFLDNSGKTVAGVAAGLSLQSTLASAQDAGAGQATVNSNVPGGNVQTRNQRPAREDVRAGADRQNVRSPMSKILLAGEQVTATGFEIKGFDYFGSMPTRKMAKPCGGVDQRRARSELDAYLPGSHRFP